MRNCFDEFNPLGAKLVGQFKRHIVSSSINKNHISTNQTSVLLSTFKGITDIPLFEFVNVPLLSLYELVHSVFTVAAVRVRIWAK